jgi:hypothetical protein
LTAHHLKKIFKESIDQESKKSISVGSGEWTICNQDSAFFKDDTIRLYSNINYFYQISKCCNFINWTFYEKKAFVQSTSQICKEPASASPSTEYYNIRFFSDKQTLYLYVIKQKSSVEVFQVLSIREVNLADNESSKEITLKRLFAKRAIIGHVY